MNSRFAPWHKVAALQPAARGQEPRDRVAGWEDSAGGFESPVLRSRSCQPHSGWSSHERHYHCQSAASAHDRGHGCPQAQPTHATKSHPKLQAFRRLAQTLTRCGNARRGARISAAPDRERDEHLQPQSDHDRGAVLVPRHAASPRSRGRGLAHQEPERLPPVLSPEEVKRVLTMATSLKARAMLTLAYGCGLRAGEVVRLRA